MLGTRMARKCDVFTLAPISFFFTKTDARSQHSLRGMKKLRTCASMYPGVKTSDSVAPQCRSVRDAVLRPRVHT